MLMVRIMCTLVCILLCGRSRAEVSGGPRASFVSRGLGTPDIGLGAAVSATYQPSAKLRLGLFGEALGTGILARSPGVYVDGHVTGSLILGGIEPAVGVGASFMSARLCGAVWCGRQTGIVPSADLRLKYILSTERGRTFGIVGEGAVYWVPASVVLPGFNGRFNLGLEWAIGGGQ